MPKNTVYRTCQHGLVLDSCLTCQSLGNSQAHNALRNQLDERLEVARPHLLRLAQLNGIVIDALEDVVQETMVEAWCHLDNLREPELFSAWLDGVCRNICKRHIHSQTNKTHLLAYNEETSLAAFEIVDPLTINPDEDLERQDRHRLLDRALGYLSLDAREMIELCYLAELPQREVAQRLGISLGALELKLHRTRKQLRQIFTTALRTDARDCGLLLHENETTGWQEARQWCWLCGKQRMKGMFEHLPSGKIALRLRCPDCSQRYGIDITNTGDHLSFERAHSFLPAFKRAVQSINSYYLQALKTHRCSLCQSRLTLRLIDRDTYDNPVDWHKLPPHHLFLRTDCPNCGIFLSDLVTVLLPEPDICSFLLNRSRTISESSALASYAGQNAICSQLVDLNSRERLTIMTHPETLQILATIRH